jgi:hypothetical protein
MSGRAILRSISVARDSPCVTAVAIIFDRVMTPQVESVSCINRTATFGASDKKAWRRKYGLGSTSD